MTNLQIQKKHSKFLNLDASHTHTHTLNPAALKASTDQDAIKSHPWVHMNTQNTMLEAKRFRWINDLRSRTMATRRREGNAQLSADEVLLQEHVSSYNSSLEQRTLPEQSAVNVHPNNLSHHLINHLPSTPPSLPQSAPRHPHQTSRGSSC